MGNKRSFIDKIFKDRNGTVVLGQSPNPPLIVWVSTTLLGLVVTTGAIGSVLDTISFGALFTWAWLELFQGVNYFRRGLGLTILVVTIVNRI